MKHDHSHFADAIPPTPRDLVEERVRRFMPLVRRTAWHVHNMGRDSVEVEDLIQVGLLALTECAHRHGPQPDDGFAAYAKLRVRGAMVDLVRRTMPDSRGAVRRRREYDAAVARLTGLNGHAPTVAELCEALGCDEAAVRAMEQDQTRLVTLDDSLADGSMALVDETPDAFTQLAALDDHARLADAVGELPERLQLLLQLFFVEELNLTEIAAVLEVSVPRVHQLRAQALQKLKERLLDPAD
ncbi:MAG: sigma-70 family RNA polymerase sigma factor [Sphingomonadaceae bacterium]|nr:sigma-70 family RNA polymerase sigma factor [Sphingomonadaceae bacterium]